MTLTEQDELRANIRFIHDKHYISKEEDGHISDDDINAAIEDTMQLITADRKRVALEARIDPFEFVESCVPDCDEVRHAYHQGQWDMAKRIEAQQEQL